jgi:hypothetical protein
MYELDRGNAYAAYELYITAQQYNAAHNIAVLELAPDAVIRKDLELLCNLFNPLSTTGRREKVDGWFVRGQVFLDYAKIMTRLPRLLDAVTADDDEDAIPDASQAQEIDDLSKRIPKIILMLPDILHRNRLTDARHPAAVEEMTKDLLKLVERAKPLLLVNIVSPIQTCTFTHVAISKDTGPANWTKHLGWCVKNQFGERDWICSILTEHRGVNFIGSFTGIGTMLLCYDISTPSCSL